MELLIKDLISIAEDNTVNRVNSDSKISRLKFQIYFYIKLSQSKLWVITSFKVGFLVFRARFIAFAKLRQGFIKALNLYYFDQEYHIWVKTDIFSYAISRVLN